MKHMQSIRKALMTVGALGALALGGSAIAGAATKSSGSSSSSAATTTTAATTATPQGGGPGGQHQANGKTEKLLSGDTASKVEKAALAKVSGGTIVRVETDADHGSPYEAHVQKSDGTQVEVLVDESFNVTAVNTMGRP
jgi:uncharacterized membrane protein YkoI